MHDDRIDALCRAVGIALDYLDAEGVRHVASEAGKRNTLEALGFGVADDTDIADSLARIAAMDLAVVEARVAAIPEDDLPILTAQVVEPMTGMRDFLKDADRRYTVVRAGNRKEHRTKAKQQRRQRRQHK